jgi:putative membrane protein
LNSKLAGSAAFREWIRVSMDEQNSQEPEARTLLAEDRTVLANERTYSAWVRTGLAALATGVAFEKFLTGSMPDWTVRAIAVILILFSGCAFFIAIWHYTHLGLKLRDAGIRKLPVRSLMVVTAALCAASILALVGLYSL